MKGAFEPLKSSEEFRNLFTLVGNNHLVAVLIGSVLTMIVQSSSATIGITIALASSGLISFEASVALILGENIGTTITANLAAIGTNLAARRTAMAHFLFNLIGVGYMLLFFPFFINVVSAMTPGDADLIIRTPEQAAAFGMSVGDKPFIARHIANTHTLFNVINTLIFVPLIGVLARLTETLIRGEDEVVVFRLKYIDNRLLSTPPIALAQARAEAKRMAWKCWEMLEETLSFIEEPDERKIPALEQKEAHVDRLQKEILDFLVALSQHSIPEEASREIASLMHMVNDLERIGDHCENLWELGQRKRDQKIVFSEMGTSEIAEMREKTVEFFTFVVKSVELEDKSILPEAKSLEESVDAMEERLRNNHIGRLNAGECGVLPGLIFIDMLHNFEKIGDHAFNIAEAVVA